jgi:hypothetical protein
LVELRREEKERERKERRRNNEKKIWKVGKREIKGS